MDVRDYPVDVRADYPQSSSRLWAVLTIFWIKGLALIPHVFCLFFLGIAQFFVALVAQFVVAFKGEYPAGMHEFVTGVLRWQTRVSAFFLTVTYRYPPFSLQPVADYPVDVVAVRPEQPSRTYAIFTIIVEILAIAGGIWLAIWFIGHSDTSSPRSRRARPTARTSTSSSTRRPSEAAEAYCSASWRRYRTSSSGLPGHRGARAVVRGPVGGPVRRALPLRDVGDRRRLRALVHAGDRLLARAHRLLSAVLDAGSIGSRGGALAPRPHPAAMTATWPTAPAPQPPVVPSTARAGAPTGGARPTRTGTPGAHGARAVAAAEPPQAPSPPGSGA